MCIKKVSRFIVWAQINVTDYVTWEGRKFTLSDWTVIDWLYINLRGQRVRDTVICFSQIHNKYTNISIENSIQPLSLNLLFFIVFFILERIKILRIDSKRNESFRRLVNYFSLIGN